jgi:hypothetical protein
MALVACLLGGAKGEVIAFFACLRFCLPKGWDEDEDEDSDEDEDERTVVVVDLCEVVLRQQPKWWR